MGPAHGLVWAGGAGKAMTVNSEARVGLPGGWHRWPIHEAGTGFGDLICQPSAILFSGEKNRHHRRWIDGEGGGGARNPIRKNGCRRMILVDSGEHQRKP